MVETISVQPQLIYYIKDDREVYVSYNGIGYKINVLDCMRDRRGMKTPVYTVIKKIKRGEANNIIDLHTAMLPRFGLIKVNISDKLSM